jgi:sec-independent protein translocase protein TatA
MAIGPWQIIIIAVLVILLFGRGKISSLMGDVAKGITSFKKGMKEGLEEEQSDPKPVADKRTIDGEATKVADDAKEKS